ncbi:MAG: hypothetical protein H6838_18070 [Planctomycetes bacterium]|nr:hypothetical protein [Planctomycetota bacterium]MCB9887403.1 hypothetical protein [Planctomycetota bacterium]
MTRSVLAALLLSVFVPAQAADATAQRAGYDKLVADWTAANRDYRAALKELQATDEYKAARDARDSAKLRELSSKLTRPDGKAFGARALELADQAGKDGAMPFYVFAVANFGDKDTALTVVERVEQDYITSAAIVPLLENAMSLTRYLGAEKGAAFLDRVVAENEDPVAKAWAMYWQAQSLQRNRNATAEDKQTAEKMLVDAEKLAAGSDLADRIAAPRFEQENLQIGMVAPDIQGADIEGVAFRLADYRGKVVLLDFWGFW